MVKEDLKMTDILTRKSFENAIMVNAALGGSTNFILHLLAIAGRIGVELNIDDFDKFEKKLSNLLKRKNKITILEKKILLNMGVDIDEIVKLTHLHDQEIVNVNEGNYDQIKF